jgi:hypothetical protein
VYSRCYSLQLHCRKSVACHVILHILCARCQGREEVIGYAKRLPLLTWASACHTVFSDPQQAVFAVPADSAGALAAALWELPLLAQHYHPHIAAAARMLLTLTPGSGSGAGGTAAAAGGSSGDGDAAAGTGAAVGAAVIAGASGPQDVAAVYGPVKLGGFKPAPLMPAAAGGRGKGRVNGVVAGSSKAGMAARQAAASRAWCQDLQQAVAAAAMPEQQSQQVQQQGKQKQQPQQRQQQQQAAVVAAAVAAADAEDLHGVEQALQEQYRLSKLYRRNNELRRELAVSAKKVELFREHLITKRQQEEQQQQQQVRPGKQEQQQPVKKKHRQHA